MTKRELRPELAARRLELLRRMAPVPDRAPETESERRDADMSPQAVLRRLDELRALDELARWLACARPAR